MIHSNRFRYSSSLSLRGEDQFRTSGDYRGGVSPYTDHFYSPKVYFDRDRHDGGFQPYQSHCTASPMALFFIRGYPVGDSGYSLFSFAARFGKVGVVPSTNHLSSQKFDF